MPAYAIKCIASWKKFFPGYEIKEWNETNFDVNICDYVREAYMEKKWAFILHIFQNCLLFRSLITS